MEETISNWIKPQHIDKLICTVNLYHRSHSEMQIEVFNPLDKSVFYLNFTALIYFDGPTMWQGADFNVQEQKECLKVLEVIGQSHSDDDVLFACRIANSPTSTSFVRIIAAAISFISEKNLFNI